MKRKLIKAVSLAVMSSMLLAFVGCGGGSSSNKSEYATTESATESAAAYDDYDYYDDYYAGEAYTEEAMAADGKVAVDANTDVEVNESNTSNRKLIKTVNMSVETKEFDNLVSGIEEQVASTGGYVESSDISNYNYYSNRDAVRHASYTVRIPADKLDSFLERVKGFSNVTSINQDVRDVTLSYTDLEAHKKSLQTEHDRLIDLLDKADTMEDILTIEERLAEVRYSLESMESQLRVMDNQVVYSTVYIDISEVKLLTVVDPETDGQRMVRRFWENIYSIGRGFKELGINIVIALPYLVLWAVIILIIFVIVRLIIKHNKKKDLKKAMAAQAAGGYDMYTGKPIANPGNTQAPEKKEEN
ncbi:MAG: DUF4349 domain-containing protein [Lachnospiraceae bacterium]|nr:DUF4349 domain-containing protein [Lachnospiraceae bacterium]MBR4993880.1 DUF4349 domain-containing protein [Lachnospiraceae bacterium]